MQDTRARSCDLAMKHTISIWLKPYDTKWLQLHGSMPLDQKHRYQQLFFNRISFLLLVSL